MVFFKKIGLSVFLLLSVYVRAELPVQQADVVILGGGIGALTSAIYLARSGVIPIVIEGRSPGGTITQSYKVQNWPGEIEITGWDLTDKIKKQALQNGVILLEEEVLSVDFSKRPFLITTQENIDPTKKKELRANSCIVAMGAASNYLGVPGEMQYWSKGVYNCAVCDGSLYKDKTVAVVGGGDAAVLEAEYLSGIAKKVYVIVRKGELKGFEKGREKDLLQKGNIDILYYTTVQEIKGDEKTVEVLVLQDARTKEEKLLAVDGVFLAIGAKPNTALFENKLELDTSGYIILKKDLETSVPGVYAIGDIIDPVYKQAISAAGDGAKAAIQAHRYLIEHKQQAQSSSVRSSAKSKGVVIEITNREQLQKLFSSHQLIIVDFYATWCGPCRYLSPFFDKWASDFKDKAVFCKVNVDTAPDLAALYQIQGMPTVLVFEGGERVSKRKVGTQEIITYVNSLRALNIDVER